jgi:hypothetical protein
METVDSLLGGSDSAQTVDDLLGSDEAAPAKQEPRFTVDMLNPDAGRDRSGRDIESLVAQGYSRADAGALVSGQPGGVGLVSGNFPGSISNMPWYERAWGDFRHSHAGRFLFGPTDEEHADMQAGRLAGAPGGDPGMVPLALTAPNPFLPGAETTAGKVLLGSFIAQNLKNQPERIAAINQKFQDGDTSGAYHDILTDIVDTAMVAGGAHELHGEFAKGFESPAQRTARVLAENVDAQNLPDLLPVDVAARTRELRAVITQDIQPPSPVAPPVLTDLDRMNVAQGRAPGPAGQKRGPAPEVPETPAEAEKGVNVVEEIRANGAKTIRQIQDLYPKAQLSREQARGLRDQVWGKPEQPAPAPRTVDEMLDAEPHEEINESEQPQNEPTAEDADVPEPNAGAQDQPKANTLPEAPVSPAPIVTAPNYPARVTFTTPSGHSYTAQYWHNGHIPQVVFYDHAGNHALMMNAENQSLAVVRGDPVPKNAEEIRDTYLKRLEPREPGKPTRAQEMAAETIYKVNSIALETGKHPNGKPITAADRARFEAENAQHKATMEAAGIPVPVKRGYNVVAYSNGDFRFESRHDTQAAAVKDAAMRQKGTPKSVSEMRVEPDFGLPEPKTAGAAPTPEALKEQINNTVQQWWKVDVTDKKGVRSSKMIEATGAPDAIAKAGKVKGVQTVHEDTARVATAPEPAPKETNGKTVDSPQKAEAKMQDRVEDAAANEGQRPAKEVKSELVQRLESAMEAAPLGANPAMKSVPKTITIDIPGDGTFKVTNTKEAIAEVLKKAKRLSIDSGHELGVPKEAVKNSATAIEKTAGNNERIRKAQAELDAQKAKQQSVTPRGSGAKIRGSKPAAANAPAASVTPAHVNALTHQMNQLRAITAPQTFSDAARYVGNLLRQLNSRMATEMLKADEALAPFRSYFDKFRLPKDWQYDPAQPLPHNLAFIRAYEHGSTAGLSPVEQRAAAEFKRQNDDWLQRVHALGTGALTTFYQNYFPHMWDDPVAAKQLYSKLLAKRPLEGPKSFLRQRTHQLFEEGLKAGLVPVHDNPVDMWLLKKREVERYILARDLINQTKASGLLKFVHSFAAKPDGMSTVNDAAFTQWGPPTVTIEEAFDASQRKGLLDLLHYIGATQERMGKLDYKNALGLAYPPPIKKNQLLVGSDESTAWHELGHQMDWAFPDLRTELGVLGNSPKAQQFRKLVDLRGEGQVVTPSTQKYFRESEEKIAEAFKAYIHAPELFQKTAPLVWDAMNQWLLKHPDIGDRIDRIKPRLAHGMESTEVPIHGFVKLGEWMMPDDAARVVNNYLSPGLNPQLWYRGLREASNLMNGAQLGLSAFHLGFTSLDAATSRLALSIEDAAGGDLARALKTAASVPVSPITNIRGGIDLREAVLGPSRGLGGFMDKVFKGITPESAPPAQVAEIVKALEAGGGRLGQDRFWRTEFTRRMIRSYREATASGYLKGTMQAPFALMEQAIKPIMEYVVPRQKLGVFSDMAQRAIEKLGPSAQPEDIREAMRKAWDSVDNRMGQLVYDNLFYHRAVKDLALLGFRAYGWQLGKYREGFGAAIDAGNFAKNVATGKKAEFTHRMAYAMALPMMIGTLGAIATYLMTGRKPEGQDYFMPPTGETDANGNPVRLNFPSYMKDVLSYSKHPVTSFAHSLNPIYSSMWDLYNNKDFYNVEIRHPDDPLLDQAGEVAKFAAKQFVPFSVSAAQKLNEDDAPARKQVLPFFGITPVSTRMTMTPAQELASDLMASGMGDAPLTKEQFDKSKMIRDAVKQMKTGAGNGLGTFNDAIATGKLNPDAMQALMERMKYNPLQFQVFHLGARDAIKVWRVASPQERTQLQPILVSKVANAKALTLTEKQGLLNELTQ